MLDASGIIHVKDNIFLVAEDERDQLRFFEYIPGKQSFQFTGDTIDFGDNESDFESLAYNSQTDTYYCIGSHSASYSKRLISFKLSADRLPGVTERKQNSETIPFTPFVINPESVNIESLSVYHNALFIGLRSPSFNDKAGAIIFNPQRYEQIIATFDLYGRTFRDMVRIDDANYLILAGPEKGKDYSRQPPLIIWWNGDLLEQKLKVLNLDISQCRAESICINTEETLEIFIGTDESKIPNSKGFRMFRSEAFNMSALLNDKLPLCELTVKLESN